MAKLAQCRVYGISVLCSTCLQHLATLLKVIETKLVGQATTTFGEPKICLWILLLAKFKHLQHFAFSQQQYKP
jgi:hypothetical protein